MMNLLPSLHTVWAALIALGVLVVIHELGHFLVARACGVTVLRFSFGFGKIIYSRKFGTSNTEWALSLIPLGGYVKMLDAREHDLSLLSEADLNGEFCRQSVWKRIAILIAGPLANFLLAIALFAGMHLYGMPELDSTIRVVDTNSVAYLSGLRNGDQIISVNQQEVQTWKDFRWQLLQHGLNHTQVVLGLIRKPVGVLSSSPSNSSTNPIKLNLSFQTLSTADFEADFLARLGMSPAAPAAMIESVLPNSAAERAGLKANDKILALNDCAVLDARDFYERVRKSPNQQLEVSVLRDKTNLKMHLQPSEVRDGQQIFGQVGVALPNSTNFIVLKVSLFDAFYKSVQNTWDVAILDFKMMGKMLSGELSLKNLTGPITIAEYAGKSLRIGIMSFLNLIAFISISLGVMNLLPIPMLDGGHLLYYSLEVFSGKPVSEKFSEIAQRIGFAILMLLMMTAFYNDILRQMSKTN